MNIEKFINSDLKKYINLTTLCKNSNYIHIIDFAQAQINSMNVDEYYLFIVDIDDFRYVNDFYGYIYGDKILKQIEQRLKDICFDNSRVCNLGANRFLIFCSTDVDLERITFQVLNTIRKTYEIESHFINLTASIGIYYAFAYEEVGIVLQNADIALNKAKTKGKNCFVIFKEALKEELYRNMKIEKNLRKAIKNEGLEIYYQPKIDTKNEELIGAEALLRWNDEELGSISPIEFIKIAERTGIIIDLGRYVIDKVCEQINEWKNKNIKYKKVAINLSSKQFKDDKLPKYIVSKLKEFNLSQDSIELEITESAFIENKDVNYKFLKELLEENIEIAIDDFGTGYSSYNLLSKISLNTLKIDKSFIDFISCDKNKSLIVKNIIELAHILDMKVVAEGVEEEQQMKILKEYGCDIIQGYYYSKPLCVQNFEEYIMNKEMEC